MYIPKVSEAVEVDIPDPGFEDSKWSGIVQSVDMERQVALIEFKDLLESDAPPVKLTEEREFEHIWPTPVDDSSTDLINRSVGDCVDCWCDDGWWKGIVYVACNDGLLVYFEATPDLSEVKGVTPETMAKGKERLRTGMDWDQELQGWTKRPSIFLEGSRDYREKVPENKLAPPPDKEGWTDEEMDPCQQFHVSDFLEGKVAYPIEQEKSHNLYRCDGQDDTGTIEKLKVLTNVQKGPSLVQSTGQKLEHTGQAESKDTSVAMNKTRPCRRNEGKSKSCAREKDHKLNKSRLQGVSKAHTNKRKSLGSKGWERLQEKALNKKQTPNKAKRALQKQEMTGAFADKLRHAPSLDWKSLLTKRSKEEGKFSGLCLCPKICVDGLGWVYDEAVLTRSFHEKLVGVRRVDFASGIVFGSGRRYSAGYACITFDSIELAVRGMIELDSYYLSIPGCPVIRPLIAHFPLWISNPWGMHGVPGQIALESCVAHFSQMNTIEFDGGVEWRRLNRIHAHAKQRLMSSYSAEIEKVLQTYKHELQQPDPKVFQKNARIEHKQTLWLKTVPETLSNEFIRSVFEQFDECCKVQRLVEPVAQESMGHVVIGFEDKEKAANVHSDMNNYLYIAGGTPRPLDVQLFEGGQPKGFESVLDSAILNIFSVSMHEFSDDWFVHVQLRKFDSAQTGRQRCSQAIRHILEKMASDRATLFLQKQKNEIELHNKHAAQFMHDCQMCKKLSDHLEEFAL